MNRKTHQSEESFDDFCREVVQVARASDEDVQSAANAPFLYQRLRAQIAAEQSPSKAMTPQRTPVGEFRAALSTWQTRWRWMFAVAAVGLVFLALAGWRWMIPAPAVPVVAKRKVMPTPTITPAQNNTFLKQETMAPSEPEQVAAEIPAERTVGTAAPGKSPRVAQRFAAATAMEESEMEETEIATEFMPLTYGEDRDDERGQIIRVEVPLSTLIAWGIPMTKELNSDRIKADIKVGDDGVALAIRLISNNNE